MSFVGPRPEVSFYVRQFKESVLLYLVLQQVHDLRGDTSIEARVKYDIWYIEMESTAGYPDSISDAARRLSQ